MNTDELINKAQSVTNVQKSGDCEWGGVGCAIETDNGEVYTGVCLDTPSSMGCCAEHNAIGSMITNSKSKINKIVAIWKDEKDDVYVIPPCGCCRELMFQINPDNIDAEIILDKNKSVSLKDLLPYPYKDNFKKV